MPTEHFFWARSCAGLWGGQLYAGSAVTVQHLQAWDIDGGGGIMPRQYREGGVNPIWGEEEGPEDLPKGDNI